ncbi:hypothetical protein ARAM_003113 [Aspergillus rambellii]|uniref:J domain-containing protein n=1 Tax=Aspergillus rambellii TaxID=308745 RepID=A0A0F8WRU1_9EURO|nr:hypothetical protein ARAM_003113 [Aspergillus rambellii]
MVKADVRRDYYADLGLGPGADSEDIKKQFRKLALKYHPDRNPGKELEFNAKFQAIQAAHEILSDPQQRLKYDTDRLRNGYYGHPKPSSARKDGPTGFSTSKQSARPSFSERPKSFHHGPSTGAQRFASYARAAPKQPWEKMRDETQTRADAYRGFQEMKGNTMPGGWSSFDPRTGRSGQPGAGPRPNATTNGSATRPKSAYEYVHTGGRPTSAESAHAQSAKKKQGFAPRAAAGGDEPMAAKTSSYRTAPRFERGFAPSPSPTARKPAAGFQHPENTGVPDYERPSHKYATTRGEKTMFDSSMLGRSNSTRASPKSPKQRPRTNPPSPTPQEKERHRSASPNLKTDRGRNYDSTSSSDLDEDDVSFKPKAVPKSRLRAQPKFSNAYTSNGWNTGTPQDSDSGSSARNASDTSVFSKNWGFFDSAHGSGSRSFSRNGGFKSNSHDDLRKSSNHRDSFNHFTETPGSSDRGRTSTRTSPHRSGHSAGASSMNDSARSESASQQQKPFVESSFLHSNWEAAFKFRDLSEALPNEGGNPQRQYPTANTQRTRSPRKPTRPTARRPNPQPATVTTEAEEAATTVEGRNGHSSSETPATDVDGEAMDLDDELPSKTGPVPAEPEKTANSPGRRASTPKSQPTSKAGKREGPNNLLNLKILSGVFPLTSTNNGGLDDLQDISSTLPFESRAKAPKTTTNDVRPRELVCPNPPKRPEPPQLVPISAGSQQLGVPRAIWNRYLAEMNIYLREWNTFERRLISHFAARQASYDTEMAQNWLGAVGGSADLEDDNQGGDSGDESDDEIPTSTTKKGFNAYMRWQREDDRVHKHWEVARERHAECMEKHNKMRLWIFNGGKVF